MKLDLFKDFKLAWWQMGIFKVAAGGVGILLGVYFTSFFSSVLTLVWIVSVVSVAYISYLWLKK